MNQKTYDPALRQAMTKIEIILNEYDIGGFVSLQSKTHGEFQTFIEPSWSTARYIKKDGAVTGLHFKSYSKSNKENTDATAGMLYGLRDTCALIASQMNKFSEQLENTVKVEHVPFGQYGITNDDR